MQVKTMSPEEILAHFEQHSTFGEFHGGTDLFRSYLKALLLHVGEQMPKEEHPEGYSDCAVHGLTVEDHKRHSRNRALRECISIILSKAKELE